MSIDKEDEEDTVEDLPPVRVDEATEPEQAAFDPEKTMLVRVPTRRQIVERASIQRPRRPE